MIGNERVKGFTLIELTVALGIFGLVMISAMAVFIASLRIHKQASASQAIIDNVRFSLEFMEREMRTGRRFTREDNQHLTFCNDRGQIVRYRLENERIERRASGSDCGEGRAEYEALTAPDVVISNFQFLLTGQSDSDTSQPRITLAFQAHFRVDPSIALRMQTTVSQRDVDVKK